MTADIPILHQLTPWPYSNRDGRKLDLAHGGLHITMHDTDNKALSADALMHSRWQDSTGPGGGVQAGVGVHLYVDDERCVQKLPLDEIGYHAGDGCNNLTDDVGCFRSVSIEMCVNRDADHAKVARNAAQIVARIALGDPAFNWGGGSTKGKFSIERIDQHRWVTQSSDPHDCPHSLRYADYGLDWDGWLRLVDAEWAARTTTPAPTPKPKPTTAPIWWTPGDYGPKRRASDGAMAFAMVGQATAAKGVLLLTSVGGEKFGNLKAGQTAKVVGTYVQPVEGLTPSGKPKAPVKWVMLEIDGQYPRARWSSFHERWPTL